MNETLSLILSVGGFIALLGGASAYYGKSKGESVIALLTKSNDAYVAENARLEKDLASKSLLVEEQAKQIAYLKDLAQGGPQLKKLYKDISDTLKAIVKEVKKK